MINEQVDIHSITADRSIEYQPIASSYFYIMLLNSLIFVLLFGAGFAALWYFDVWTTLQTSIIIGVLVLLVVVRLVLLKWSFKFRGYAVRQHDVMYRKGVLSVEEILVPYNRVQHVKLRKGIFSKMFGLSDLLLFTAAGNNFNMVIVGLPTPVAEQIKTYVMTQLSEELPLNVKEETATQPISEAKIEDASEDIVDTKATEEDGQQ